MTLQEFRSLRPELQQTAVKCFGVFLLGRTGVGVTAKLYQINGFYVELFFDVKTKEVIRIVSFDDTHKLDPYLRLVNVSALQPLL